MKTPHRSQPRRSAVATTTAVLLLLTLPMHARARRPSGWVESQFATAQLAREALNEPPAQQHTRHEYQHVIDAYRRVYHGAPRSSKADPSAAAVADLLTEMGRRFADNDALRSAIRQYEFLRREYPGSKRRIEALFRIGELYKNDLHEQARGDAAFAELVRRYPRNPLAADARKALSEPAQAAALKEKETSKEPAKDDADASPRVLAKQDSQTESPSTASDKASRVTAIRHWSTPDYTRVAIDLEQGVRYDSQRIDHPSRVFFDLFGTTLDSRLLGKSFEVNDGVLKKVRLSQFKSGQTRVVLELDADADYSAALLANPSRLIIDVHGQRTYGPTAAARDAESAATQVSGEPAAEATEVRAKESDLPDTRNVQPSRRLVVTSNGVKKTIVDAEDDDVVAKLDSAETPSAAKTSSLSGPSAPGNPNNPKTSTGKIKRKSTLDLDPREARPTATGDRSLIRALGLKIGKIVIDPGHGGHDTGTVGPNGLEEKDLVLDVSRRLGKLLATRMGAEVVYTRKDDTFIPLETRTAIANQEGADLFVSVHANSSHDQGARGVETYYLNFTSSPEALEVAARENAVSDKSIHELQDLVKKIALKEKIEESREFAADVQRSLHSGLAAKNPGIRDRGVKKAPFIVLIGANMPSILAEISFVSNPGDEHRLETPEYRQRIAESLYRGISKYVSGLSGVKVASRVEKQEGQ